MAPPRPRSSSADPQRLLMIKTKTCQRLIKEREYYEKEVQENQAKLEQMIQEGRDPYDVKKFREVVGESEMMVPDSTKRMQLAILDLERFVQENEKLEGEFLETAKQILADHSPEASKVVEEREDHRVVETNVADLAEGEIF